MTELDEGRAAELLHLLEDKRVLIIGDVMLDSYVWGKVSRMSPEAPVPVVEIEEEAFRLGGAANVAANVLGLGAQPLLVGLTGAGDEASRNLRELMESEGLSTAGLLEDPLRKTTVKTRIIAHQQHVVRADREDRSPAEADMAGRICDTVSSMLGDVDAVILQDYNKGVLSTGVLESLLPILIDSGLPVAVDPKFERFFDYRGVTVFKPNLREVEMALGRNLTDEESVTEAARLLREELGVLNVLITRGEHGMTLLEEDGTVTHVGTRARHVFDVSGAGDTVIAALSCALAAGGSVREAATLANFAAGVVVAEVGAVPISRAELLQAVGEIDA